MTDLPERTVARTFVELADTLVADFDLIDFLDLLTRRCVELLGVDQAGLMVADMHGTLTLVAASSEQVRLLELFQLQNREGACMDAYRTGEPVDCVDLATAVDRWPAFAPAALNTGFRAVHALPMRLRDEIIGALNLFGTRPGSLADEELSVAQAFADVATIGILHERTLHHREMLVEQLNQALNSRVVIEQAKGVLAERLDIGVADAFSVLRDHARRHNVRLGELAAGVVNGDPELVRLFG